MKNNINYSPASLAYIGDAVFELLARTRSIDGHDLKAAQLHKKTVKIVNASSQAKMSESLLSILDEEESAIYRRGRNTAVHSMPKNANLAEYTRATGLEAVFGHLYILGKTDRINELFEFCVGIEEI